MSQSKQLLIQKKILHTGTKTATFKDQTKVKFHFQTRKRDGTIVDDSKTLREGQPMELVLGKKFKLEVWEAIVQQMAVGELAEFTVNKSLVKEYPFVSKTLRDISKPQKERHHSTHMCAASLQTQGVGYDDLNDLLKNPIDLVFMIDLISVQQPEDYEKETWQLDDTAKMAKIPQLQADGNKEYKNGDYEKAAMCYLEAITYLDQFMLREKPQSDEWHELRRLKTPIALNYAQCKLKQNQFYETLEYCNQVLKDEPNNIKALFRRGKANVGAWNPDQARNDFERVVELDIALKDTVKKELDRLGKLMLEKDKKDAELFKRIF